MGKQMLRVQTGCIHGSLHTRATLRMRRFRRGPSLFGMRFDSSASAPLAPNIGLARFVPALPLRF
jgi:hypothetical protein